MAIRFPGVRKDHQRLFNPLRACIAKAVRGTGLHEYAVATVMTYFLEELCDQVALGRVVRIPGFGIFGSMTWRPRKGGLPPHCIPSFSAATGFRDQVRWACAPGTAMDMLVSHRRHKWVERDDSGSRPFLAFRVFRQTISKAAADANVVIPSPDPAVPRDPWRPKRKVNRHVLHDSR
jgi:nucleoid DNA-binding protein